MPADQDAPSLVIQPPPKRVPPSRAVIRRGKIFRSLHDCMINKGFVKTTLSDIADGAGMSASHLLYYFNGKEDVLEQYFERVSVRFLKRIEEFSVNSAQDQIEMLADWWFKSDIGAKNEIGFMLECFGAAVHDDVLKVTKSDFDVRCKSYLRRLFNSSDILTRGAADDSAEIAYSMMIGLRSAVYFDDTITLDYARKLFVNTVKKIYGI